ncbi:hypothetical protein V501_02816 [Pseudogymnoascus sp. VKM F-4519 (FW-2642)]|nr:hypothetical protein V501_02816 [Pseudogymnoascus sp. VKM F-4519 (FW-2642)]
MASEPRTTISISTQLNLRRLEMQLESEELIHKRNLSVHEINRIRKERELNEEMDEEMDEEKKIEKKRAKNREKESKKEMKKIEKENKKIEKEIRKLENEREKEMGKKGGYKPRSISRHHSISTTLYIALAASVPSLSIYTPPENTNSPIQHNPATMASQPPPPPHSDPNLPVENPEPLTCSEQLDLRKDEMALECAEVQHQRNIAVLKINLLRHETTLRIETERELERVAEKERERRGQAERDNNDTVDLVVELFTPFTPRDTSPTPSYEMAQITLRQRETALSKASKELAIEKAAFFLKKAEFQREKDEFAAATNKAILAVKQKRAKEMERLWEGVFTAAIVFLVIPVVALGSTLIAVEAVGAWRMFVWAIAAAAGH